MRSARVSTVSPCSPPGQRVERKYTSEDHMCQVAMCDHLTASPSVHPRGEVSQCEVDKLHPGQSYSLM